MANTLTDLIPKLLAQGAMTLRQQCITPRLVNRDFDTIAAQKGSVINVPIPAAIAVADVTPANTPPGTTDMTLTTTPVSLTRWKEAAFYLSDKDKLEVEAGIIPMQAAEAIKALANEVDSYILGLYKYFYGYAGTAGTTPFGDEKTTDASALITQLNQQLAPMDDRHVVLDAFAQGKAINVRAFQDASYGGGNGVLLKGQMGEKLGASWWMNQNIPYHTAGTITTGLIAKAATAQAVDDTSIVCTTAASTGACALVEGDIITFAGHTQTYVVTAAATQASANSDVTVNIYPGLKTALAGSEAVTVKASHRVNLGFNKYAIAFASRPLEQDSEGLGAPMQTVADPISGVVLRLEVRREYKRTRWSFDILYGAAVVRRELGARLAG